MTNRSRAFFKAINTNNQDFAIEQLNDAIFDKDHATLTDIYASKARIEVYTSINYAIDLATAKNMFELVTALGENKDKAMKIIQRASEPSTASSSTAQTENKSKEASISSIIFSSAPELRAHKITQLFFDAFNAKDENLAIQILEFAVNHNFSEAIANIYENGAWQNAPLKGLIGLTTSLSMYKPVYDKIREKKEGIEHFLPDLIMKGDKIKAEFLILQALELFGHHGTANLLNGISYKDRNRTLGTDWDKGIIENVLNNRDIIEFRMLQISTPPAISEPMPTLSCSSSSSSSSSTEPPYNNYAVHYYSDADFDNDDEITPPERPRTPTKGMPTQERPELQLADPEDKLEELQLSNQKDKLAELQLPNPEDKLADQQLARPELELSPQPTRRLGRTTSQADVRGSRSTTSSSSKDAGLPPLAPQDAASIILARSQKQRQEAACSSEQPRRDLSSPTYKSFRQNILTERAPTLAVEEDTSSSTPTGSMAERIRQEALANLRKQSKVL